MNEIIKSTAIKCGACKVGIIKARKFDEIREILSGRGKVQFAEEDIEKRINPFSDMPWAKSIIVCLFSYNVRKENHQKKIKISDYTNGIDYHIVLENRLKGVTELLEKEGYRAQAFADNASLVDRHLAYLAGLGFFGKNSMLINDEYGSYVFIGYVVTDCECSYYDKPLDNKYCIGCNKCINACPAKAISDNFGFCENLCVSYLTQKKGELTEKEQEIIKKSGYIWGCDICQEVCPYNYTAKFTNIQEFSENPIGAEDIDLTISNREFKKKYSDKAFSWRGKGVISRNMDLFR